MEYKYYGIDKRFFNKICTVLKYMSLIPPLGREGFLKDNYFSCENAFNLLNTLLTQTEWVKNTDIDKGLFEGDFMCKLPDEYCELISYINRHYNEEEFKDAIKLNSRELHNFESNYRGGYYGEIYDTINNRPGELINNNFNLKPFNQINYILDELIPYCLRIESYKSYFARNIFNRNINIKHFSILYHLFVDKNKNKFNHSERQFLFLIFDSLHNLPEVIETSYKLLNNEKTNKYCIKLFEKELNEFIKLINNKAYRLDAGIKDNNQIINWCNELNRLTAYTLKALEIISKLKEIGFIEKENIN